MGEVYRARDTRLDRTIAIKVLPPDLAQDAQFRARFDREARAISQLTHPHICTLYDVGDADGTAFLVMERLQGQTLADRIRKGALPLDEALKIAVEIADALSAAHRLGIVHRDLKPGNIMLTKTGAKLLDFGLAKAAATAVAIGAGADSLTASTHLTGAGSILGTLHYMAPEQVEGREADTRSDIWALGAVIYEMVTGQQVFAGDSAAGIVGAILKDRPLPLSARCPEVPPALDHLVTRCLERDVDERWQSASDVKRQLTWIAGRLGHVDGSSAAERPRRFNLALAAVGSLALLAIAASIGAWLNGRTPARPSVRTTLSIPSPERVRMIGASAISPDGRNFAFVGLSPDGPPSLWLYSIETGISRELPGSVDASYPFWSPRSDALGFFAGGQLKTVTLTGAAPRAIAPASSGRGGAWGADGFILYAGVSNGPLSRVPQEGGSPTLVLSVDPTQGQVGYRYPTIIDDRHFVYQIQGAPEVAGLYLATTSPPSAVRLTTDYSNSAFLNGQLLYLDNGMLVSRTLDVEHARFTSGATAVAGPVSLVRGLGYAAFSVSSTGDLTYSAGGRASAGVSLRWLNRQGRPVGEFLAGTEVADLQSYGVHISPDGKKVAFNAIPQTTNHVWIADIERDAVSRFTVGNANDQYPIWSADSSEVVFASNRTGYYNLYRKLASGVRPEQPFLPASTNRFPTDWSRDGETIVFTNLDPKTQVDIWTTPVDGSAPTPFLNSPANELAGRLSRDGHWMAYVSDETGRPEVYVQRFPGGGDKVQISTQGGSEPQWRADEKELFYVAANHTLMSVPLDVTTTLTAGRPAKLFDTLVDTMLGSFGQIHYAATDDGQRFLVSVSPETVPPMMLVLGWTSPLEQ